MSVLRKLAGQTAIYGVSSIVARFLNYLLTPLYTSRGVFAPAAFGVITSLYAWTAFLNVVLTYGMETTFFRFASKHEGNKRIYTTAVYLLAGSTVVFLSLGMLFAHSIAAMMGYPDHVVSVRLLVLIIGIEAMATVPMANLRLKNRPWKFAAINVASVLLNVVMSLFIFMYCMPKYNAGESNALINAVYDPSFGVGYVFLLNLISSSLKFLLLLPEWPPLRFGNSEKAFDTKLLRPMLAFGLPLLVAGLAGMTNETADRVLMKHLLPANIADAQIGIYGACYKLAMLITLFIQAFRFAAEPFFFSHAKEKDSRQTFARIMNIFVAVCMSAFLLVMLFLDAFKWFIPNPAYWPGLVVVPVLMLANVFLGIYYNQSVWYKLSDRTRAGSTISIIGAIITLTLLFWWIPIFGYLGAAWATFLCYASMAVISYVWGQKHYPVPYNVARVLGYMAGGVFLWWGCEQLPLEGPAKYAVRAVVFLGAVGYAWKLERSSVQRTTDGQAADL
ncbi:MAG: oligosaccharide flippase family protein [Flavobacteriales bacterium]|nr:oligosaccharide flippase family protein [Flavobacteriales bacterium]MBK7247196.1 oligosaccharide flippase family protein [Flavobacteriales bacterium]MBK7288664.1 oligosaccharide flippase family protein [Flavobacteriales bacterium]MBK9058318.1 oligosaccharide flippase family protein [Flavobacteriales bacterium]MBK9599556.1 oligosaccharide flippase family protein [Flavobacteriales bacterium]